MVRVAASRAAMANVQVEILHHFSAGKASIWVDDQLVAEQILHGGNQHHLLFHSVEMNQTTSFRLSAGKHSLRIHVVSPVNTYDQVTALDATLAAGSESVLQVNCDKHKLQVTLQ